MQHAYYTELAQQCLGHLTKHIKGLPPSFSHIWALTARYSLVVKRYFFPQKFQSLFFVRGPPDRPRMVAAVFQAGKFLELLQIKRVFHFPPNRLFAGGPYAVSKAARDHPDAPLPRIATNV